MSDEITSDDCQSHVSEDDDEIDDGNYFPEEEEEVVEEDDEEEENRKEDRIILAAVTNRDDAPTPAWTSASIGRLLSRISAALPAVDAGDANILYDSYVQQEMLDWQQISFEPFSADDCKRKWTEESKDLRRFRFLNELVEELATAHGVELGTILKPVTLGESLDESSYKSSPDPPEKPLTALQLFVSAVRDKLEAQSKSRHITANAYSHIVKNWKTHPEKERIVFIRRAMEYWKEYERRMAEYQKWNPRYRAYQCTVTKEERALLDKVSGKPTKPAGSAYVLFLQETLPTLKQHPPKSRMAVVSQLWSELPEEKRAVYHDKFSERQKVYRDACIKYEMEPLRGVPAKRKAENPLESLTNSDEPSNAYSFFSKMAAPVLKFNAAPTVDSQNMDQRAAERLEQIWKELTPEEKRIYEPRADVEGGKTTDAGTRPAHDLNEVEMAQQRILRQLLAGAPKKPPSCAYHLFLRESYPKLTDLPQKERTRLLAKHWTNLPPEAKMPFALRSAEMQKVYDVELSAFLETVPPETKDMVRKKAMGRRRYRRKEGGEKMTKLEPELRTDGDGHDAGHEAGHDAGHDANGGSSDVVEDGNRPAPSLSEDFAEDDAEVTLDYELDEGEEGVDEEKVDRDVDDTERNAPLKISADGFSEGNNYYRSDNVCPSDTETESGEE